MKRKILALGLLSLGCLAWLASESQAFHGLFSPWHRHNRGVTQITCRPYNAFTPMCWGNLVCDGCCPSPCGVAAGCLPMNMGMPAWAGCGVPQAACMPGGFGGNFAYASDMQQMQPAPYMQPLPDIRSTPFTPPAPMPIGPGGVGPNISQANYHPMYMPQQYPNYYMPTYYNPYQGWQQPVPYYWHGQGR